MVNKSFKIQIHEKREGNKRETQRQITALFYYIHIRVRQKATSRLSAAPDARRMAAVASAGGERRGSSFLDAVRDVDDADGTAAEWAAMSSGERVQFDDGPPTEEEAAKLLILRKNLHDLVATPPLKDQPENVSDFKMLRFLRGYAGDAAAAEKAYRDMADFRSKQGLEKLREKLLAEDCQSPHLLKEFAPIVRCLRVRHHYGMDTYGNLLTMTDIGALD